MNTTEGDMLTDWNNKLTNNYVVNNVFLFLYLFLGIIGNVLVIIIYNFRMTKKKDDRYFIPFLAVMDLFACIFRSSLELAMNFNPVNFQGSALCKSVWFPTNFFAISSILLLLVIAIQRYLKICRPFGPQMTLMRKRFALGACVSTAIAFSIPLIFYNEEIKVFNLDKNITGFVCDIDLERYYGVGFLTYTVIVLLSSLGIMIALTVCNILIGRTICFQIKAKHKRNMKKEPYQHVNSFSPLVLINITPDTNEDIPEPDMKSSIKLPETTRTHTNNNLQTSSPDEKPKYLKKMAFAHRYSFMFMLIGVAFIISYFPRLIILAITFYDPKFFGKISDTQLTLVAFSREMNVINNVVNPFIYGFFDRKFRKESKKLICCQS